MADDALAICNMSLVHVGGDIIEVDASEVPPDLPGEDKPSQLCNLWYETARDYVLRLGYWRFASALAYFDYTDYLYTVTGATQASPVVVTCTGHPFEDGQTVVHEDVSGMTDINGTIYKVANKATNTYELTDMADQDIDGTAFSAYSSGGTARMKPPFKYAKEYALPSDCLKIWKIYGSESNYEQKKGNLLIDDAEVYLEYIARITDTTKYSAQFTNLLSLWLAIKLSLPLADSKTMRKQVIEDYKDAKEEILVIEPRLDNPAKGQSLTSWQSAGH